MARTEDMFDPGDDPPDIDELRVPLGTWIDPAAPDGAAERHIVRSID
jgi:hypothetical protein